MHLFDKRLYATIFLSVLLDQRFVSSATTVDASSPVVTVVNGSYQGIFSQQYMQDFFLGIPYSQPPTGDLRFRSPQSLNVTWTGIKNATDYSPECYGYGRDTWSLGNIVSEDCLTLNVVRPSYFQGLLPVAVWIHVSSR